MLISDPTFENKGYIKRFDAEYRADHISDV